MATLDEAYASSDRQGPLQAAFEAGNAGSGYVDWYAWLASRTAVRAGQLIWNQAQGSNIGGAPKYRCLAVPPTLLERLSRQDRLAVSHFHTTWQRAGVSDFAACYEEWRTRFPLSPCAVAFFGDLAQHTSGKRQAHTSAQRDGTADWLEGTLGLMRYHVQTLDGSRQPELGHKRGHLQLGLAHASAYGSSFGNGDVGVAGANVYNSAQTLATPEASIGAYVVHTIAPSCGLV